MSQEPKKRHSRARQGKRRAAIHLGVSKTINCANCGSKILSHSVCKTCGYYKGSQIVVKKEKKVKEEASA